MLMCGLLRTKQKTQKDAYPLPLPDEVQDKLAGAAMFTTLDSCNRATGKYLCIQRTALKLHFTLDQVWVYLSFIVCLLD